MKHLFWKTGSHALFAMLALGSGAVHAAEGEMGAGVPEFGMYSATGTYSIVTNLRDATAPFPAGCPTIMLSAATMGLDNYKLAIGTMVAARLTNKKIRFYAHAPRDGGCGVDYVALLD